MDQVAKLLKSRYGLAIQRLEAAPRGWTGVTYVATVRDGARYFIKVYPRHRLPRTAIGALPVLAELHQHGLTEVSRPITATSGALHEWLGSDLVVVFDYLDATQVEAATLAGDQRGDLIARVHQQTEQLESPLERETFEVRSADELWPLLTRARQEPASDEPRRGLLRFLDQQENGITQAAASFNEVAEACRAARFELVLTHSDWPFNLLQGADHTIYLVDWDEMLLAPAERDTWFGGDDPAFWRGYCARRSGHVENELATAFYLHDRYFEELHANAQIILGDDMPERRDWALALLSNNWMTSLRSRIGKQLT